MYVALHPCDAERPRDLRGTDKRTLPRFRLQMIHAIYVVKKDISRAFHANCEFHWVVWELLRSLFGHFCWDYDFPSLAI